MISWPRLQQNVFNPPEGIAEKTRAVKTQSKVNSKYDSLPAGPEFSFLPYNTERMLTAACSRNVYLFPLRNRSDDPVQSHSALCRQHQAVVALALKTRGKHNLSLTGTL